MKKLPSVSVIVLNYNGLAFSRECLNSLLASEYPNSQIILVDNGSAVNEAAILHNEFNTKRIRFIRFEKNWGFAEGNNRVAQKLRTKYLVFLNNDTVVDPQWLEPLVNEMESGQNIGACQSKIRSMDKPKEFDYAGAAGGLIDKFGYPFTRGRIFFTAEEDQGQYDRSKDLFWTSGVAMIIRRQQFLDLGMFDERFFLYMEEIDLCWRMQNAGFRIRLVPKSIVYHKVSAAAKKNMTSKRFYEYRNNLILLAKNYSRRDLILLFPQRLLLETIALGYFLLKGDFPSTFGLVKAHLNFWYLLPVLFLQRQGKHINIKKFTQDGYRGCIVKDYFLCHRKTYNKL